MSIQKYLEKIKNVQNTLLEFLEQKSNAEESYQNLFKFLNTFIIHDKNELRLFLHLISKISKNYQRTPDFISKIIRIIEYLEESIKKYLSNSEIFKIFKNSKRILLFLVEKKIIIFNVNIIKKIIQPKYLQAKYPQYFQPEIRPFMNEKWFPKYETETNQSGSSINNKGGLFSIFGSSATKNEWVKELEKELPDNFNEMRKSGENEDYICKLIRNDSVEEFITYVNNYNYSLNSIIKSSIFETNSFLIKKQIESDRSIAKDNNKPVNRFDSRNSSNQVKSDKDDKLTLIKYAAFFGSIQIFKYLQINGVKLTPQLWYFAIHSKNAEIIHLLKENHIEFENLFEKCFEEAIKCHHIEIANFFLNNFLQNNKKSANNSFVQGLKYYNFSFLQGELINENSLFYMCQLDYYYFACMILNDNTETNKILAESFQFHLKSYI